MQELQVKNTYPVSPDTSILRKISKDFTKNKDAYLMILPVVIFYLIFHYKPMYGAIMAFQDFSPMKGISGSSWVGLKHFYNFFESFYFWRTLKNTLVISFSSLIFGFPAPIILALLINELKSKTYSRIVQSVTYMPHFISLVVVCSLISEFTKDTGIINYALGLFGWHHVTMLSQPGYFVPIYVISGIWQEVGWGSIIYLAALAGVDEEQYEAAKIDGANRWRQTLHITLPGIAPTIVILLILRVGSIMSVGFEKIILLYNPVTYETADVISTFVYRKGLEDLDWGFSSAVGLFNSVINFILLICSNWLSRKLNDTSLW